MTTLLNGVLGGLLSGLIAGCVTWFVDSDPSAAMVRGRLNKAGTSPHWGELPGLVVYGGLTGGILVALELYVLGLLAVPPAVGEALGVAIAWIALLFALWAVVIRVGFSKSSEWSLRALFVYHLVYGIGLGVWIRVTWIT